VIVVSGELSITSALDELPLDLVLLLELVFALDEQAPTPAARMPAAATVKSLFWLLNLLMELRLPVVGDRGAVGSGDSFGTGSGVLRRRFISGVLKRCGMSGTSGMS
jgi:hypothetical protein